MRTTTTEVTVVSAVGLFLVNFFASFLKRSNLLEIFFRSVAVVILAHLVHVLSIHY